MMHWILVNIDYNSAKVSLVIHFFSFELPFKQTPMTIVFLVVIFRVCIEKVREMKVRLGDEFFNPVRSCGR